MSNADASTSETLALPWRAPDDLTETPVLHLVVAWFTGEAERIGQVGRIDRKCFFGRGAAEAHPDPVVTFEEVRPGESIAAPLVDNVAISRRQLDFEPVDAGSVRVRCVGRRPLSHNGVPSTECVVRAGDTLTLENAAVFLVEARPPALPPVAFYPAPRFRFGRPDAHGIVGETPIMAPSRAASTWRASRPPTTTCSCSVRRGRARSWRPGTSPTWRRGSLRVRRVG